MTALDWTIVALILIAVAFFCWRVWSGDFDNVPYPAINGSKLEQAIRGLIAESEEEK